MPSSISSFIVLVLWIAVQVHYTIADGNDWVTLEYLFDDSANQSPTTLSARQNIIGAAGKTAQQGPWTITDSKSYLPPSGNSHDYLSWAPYHWPDCNWCGTKSSRDVGSTTPFDHDSDPSGHSGSTGSANRTDIPSGSGAGISHRARRLRMANVKLSGLSVDAIMGRAAEHISHSSPANATTTHHPSHRASASAALPQQLGSARALVPTSVNLLSVLGIPSPTELPQQLAANVLNPTVPELSAFTAVLQPAAAKKAAKCTPSPTTHMAPSATWTTCPYVVRDGKVNPDTRNLTGSNDMVSMSQSVLYNAIAYVLQGNQPAYSKQASSFLDTFFLSPSTAINPNVNFGQLVRGPGPQGRMGTFTGVLDLRGMVKVVNAIAMLMYAGSPDWTSQRHGAMRSWMSQYIGWLENSNLGKEVAGKPNNHGSFYFNQLTVTKVYLGDLAGAQDSLRTYFNTTFLDQIAVTGEQPFEAVRTRPYHYRCFNLEAMITNAKLGDELGLNFWTAKSKYGATIQTAVDYTMVQDPKGEDATELVPHVLTVVAAYGDPTGKYAAFLQKTMPDYTGKPIWFYDQARALPNSPAGRSKSRSSAKNQNQSILSDMFGRLADKPLASTPDTGDSDSVPSSDDGGDDASSPEDAPVDFECPAVFLSGPQAEVDDGIFVTCDELKPFYQAPSQTSTGTM